MNKKIRKEGRKGTLGKKKGNEMPEVFSKEEPSRHKWFRKQNKGGNARRSFFDDEYDDEYGDNEYEYYEYEDDGDGPELYAGHKDISNQSGEEIMSRATQEDVWGIASAIDIYGCNPKLIRDADQIRNFVAELCEIIEMKRFGETQVVHFGEDERVAGYSMVQLIETSLISAHFANQTNTVYLDVFSCKPYNPQVVREFSQAFFQGSRSSFQVTLRR